MRRWRRPKGSESPPQQSPLHLRRASYARRGRAAAVKKSFVRRERPHRALGKRESPIPRPLEASRAPNGLLNPAGPKGAQGNTPIFGHFLREEQEITGREEGSQSSHGTAAADSAYRRTSDPRAAGISHAAASGHSQAEPITSRAAPPCTQRDPSMHTALLLAPRRSIATGPGTLPTTLRRGSRCRLATRPAAKNQRPKRRSSAITSLA